MARVNITIPDDLYRQARHAGLNISQLTQRAVAGKIDRRVKIADLDRYLAELDTELGPTTEALRAEAAEWADRAVGRRRDSA